MEANSKSRGKYLYPVEPNNNFDVLKIIKETKICHIYSNYQIFGWETPLKKICIKYQDHKVRDYFKSIFKGVHHQAKELLKHLVVGSLLVRMLNN